MGTFSVGETLSDQSLELYLWIRMQNKAIIIANCISGDSRYNLTIAERQGIVISIYCQLPLCFTLICFNCPIDAVTIGHQFLLCTSVVKLYEYPFFPVLCHSKITFVLYLGHVLASQGLEQFLRRHGAPCYLCATFCPHAAYIHFQAVSVSLFLHSLSKEI